jgi:hypothetical protein
MRSLRTQMLVCSLLPAALSACQTAESGAVGGAVAGAVVGGPVGAVVGGVAGAAAGAALTPEETTRVRTYVVAQRRPSVRLREEVRWSIAAASGALSCAAGSRITG